MQAQREQILSKFIKENELGSVDFNLLDQALTHKSFANEIKSHSVTENFPELFNERLEFLGDTVLGMIIAKALFTLYPKENEGNLTKKKAQAVCEATLAEVGDQLDIGSFLKMGKGELNTGGASRRSNIADAVEALIGAIFLSEGYETTEKLLLHWFRPYLKEGKTSKDSIDYKSKLQELLIQKIKVRPEYKVLEAKGPDHKKEYTVGMYIKGEQMSTGVGSSRKRAEQEAAKVYLDSQS